MFSVAATERDEEYPAVAFSGGTQSFSGGMGADQFLITYRREGDSTYDMYGQAIKGTHAASGGQRAGDPVHLRTSDAWWFQFLDVTGSINNGRYMVIWNECSGVRRAGADGGTVWSVPATSPPQPVTSFACDNGPRSSWSQSTPT